MGRRGGARLLAVVAGAVVSVSACSDGEAAPTPPSAPSASAAATVEPAPTLTAAPTESALAPPVMPPEAAEQTADGAAAFVEYWFALVNHAYATGDSETLESVSHPDCMTCASVVQQVEGRYAAGGGINGGQISVVSAQASPLDDIGVSLVSAVYDQEPIVELAADGSTVAEGTGETGSLVSFYAQYVDGAWIAFEVDDE